MPLTTPTQSTASKRARTVKAGEIDPFTWYHKGAIISNVLGGQDLVLEEWGEQNGQHGAVVVGCDDAGTPLDGERGVLETELPAAYTHRHGAAPDAPNSRVMLRSQIAGIPPGIRSNDPALLVVPFGPLTGRMLGELTIAQLAQLKEETGSGLLKRAIAHVKPERLRVPTEPAAEPGGATSGPPAPAEDMEARQRVARQAREMRQRELTQQIKTVPLTRVVEDIHGITGEKSGPRAMKYRVGDVLILVNNDTNSFGALNGHQFVAFRGKAGSKGAIDLVIACAEADGRTLGFKEAREIVQRTFLPTTLTEFGARRPKLDLKVGQVNPAAWFHKGAVIQPLAADGKGDPDKTFRVVEPWASATRSAKIVDCDEAGHTRKVGSALAERREVKIAEPHPTAADLAGGGAGGPPAVLLHSQHPMIRPGLRSDDPAFQLVPFGPFGGMMLGQLNEEQLAHVSRQTTSGRLKGALARTKPGIIAPGANEPKGDREDPEAEVPIDLPPRLDMLKLPERSVPKEGLGYKVSSAACGDLALDNLRIVRDYLVSTRKLRAETVDAALSANAAYPTESVVYKRDEEGNPTEEVLYRHPAICIPISGLKTQEPIAYQLKVIYLDPALAKRFKGNDSYNFGPVTRGFATVGSLHAGTKAITLTEAWIDGMSKWDLHQYGPEHCVMATTGSRMPHDLIAECHARGIELNTAMDNDGTGRAMAAKVRAECARLGVKGEDQVVTPSEFHLGLKDNETGRSRLEDAKRFCVEHRVMHIVEPTKKGWIRVTVDNTQQSAYYMDELKKKDSIARQHEKREEKHVIVEVRNKDWNDLVKGDYQRTFTRDFERQFQAAEGEAEVARVARERAMEISASAGPNANEALHVGVTDSEATEKAPREGAVLDKDAIGLEVALTDAEGLEKRRVLTDTAGGVAPTTIEGTPREGGAASKGTTTVTHDPSGLSESYEERQMRRVHERRPEVEADDGPSLG